MAQLGEKEKCDTCITKALAIDSNCADAYIVRARVSSYEYELDPVCSTI